MRGHKRRVGIVVSLSLAAALVLLYAPLVQLVISSLNTNSLGSSWEHPTLGWYRRALDNELVVASLWRSVRLALAVAFSAALLGTGSAIAVRHRPRIRSLAASLATARVATPEILVAVGLGVLLPLADIQLGVVAMWFGHTVLLSAYVVLIVSARLQGMPEGLEDAAQDLGAPPWRVIRHVVMPQVTPAGFASTLLVAAFSFDDVILSLRLSGPTDTTLPMVILSMAQRRPSPELDAIGAVVIMIGIVCVGAATLAIRIRRVGEKHSVIGGL